MKEEIGDEVQNRMLCLDVINLHYTNTDGGIWKGGEE